MTMPVYFADIDSCIDEVIAKIGHRIVLAIPLAIGKPNQLVNAFFQRALADPALDLKIITALSLEIPRGGSELENRFLEPFVARVFDDYPELDYVAALRTGELPANIEVAEFFFKPGSFIDVANAQQNYISANYTHVARDLVANGVNVLAQLVAKKTLDGKTWFSLGSNPDVTPDLLRMLRERERQGMPIAVIGQVNDNMPFMYHDALLEADSFDMIVDERKYDFRLFGPPNLPVDTVDYWLGIHASTLIKDGGTLQIGIGSLGDAITHLCQLRHTNNPLYRELLSRLGIAERCGELIATVGGTGVFEQGLYGASEMFVNGFWHLYRSGILKRAVYESVPVQRLINQGEISEIVTPETLAKLLEGKAIPAKLTKADFDLLQRYGIFKEHLRYQDGAIEVSDEIRIAADLSENWEPIVQYCLGARLKNGILLHAGFFLGPQSLYEALRTLEEAESKKFFMTSVGRVNQLYGNEELAVLQRKDARFLNTAIMATLSGAAVSDGLENGQVISGVGGQYNFVAMAHALPGARSILMVRSTREHQGAVRSNIVWNYGHVTIPRHLRDIVVTEYGIADLRGKSDQAIIAALLNIADSRFQQALLEQAKLSGKIAKDYQIPPPYRDNTPQRLEAQLSVYKAQGHFPDFPLGTDFSPEEIVLAKVLKALKAHLGSLGTTIKKAFQALEIRGIPEAAQPYLARLQLDEAETWKDQFLQKLIVAELIAGGHVDGDNS